MVYGKVQWQKGGRKKAYNNIGLQNCSFSTQFQKKTISPGIVCTYVFISVSFIRWIAQVKKRNSDEFFQSNEASIRSAISEMKEAKFQSSKVEIAYFDIVGDAHFKALLLPHHR